MVGVCGGTTQFLVNGCCWLVTFEISVSFGPKYYLSFGPRLKILQCLTFKHCDIVNN